jgi:hypothetical protein
VPVVVPEVVPVEVVPVLVVEPELVVVLVVALVLPLLQTLLMQIRGGALGTAAFALANARVMTARAQDATPNFP